MSGKLDPVAIAGQTATGFNDKSSDFEKLQWAIAELEKREKNDTFYHIDIKKDLKFWPYIEGETPPKQ